MSRRIRIGDVLVYLALCAIALFSMGPILWMVVTSLKPDADIVKAGIDYFPWHPTLNNYVEVWSQSGYPSLLDHSVVVTATTLAICILVGTPAAYALSRLPFHGRRKMLLALIATRMLPAVLIIAPMFSMLRIAGLLDTLLGLSLAYSALLLPFYVWILKSFFDKVPDDVEDAAKIDGASPLVAMVKIAIPLSKQGLFAAAVFTAVAAWNEFLFALMFTTSQGSRTWPVGLQMMVGNYQLPWGDVAASGVLSVAPIAVLFILGRRLLVATIDVETRDA